MKEEEGRNNVVKGFVAFKYYQGIKYVTRDGRGRKRCRYFLDLFLNLKNKYSRFHHVVQ